MYVILGASGQVGGAIVERLLQGGATVKAVVHSVDKADALRQKGAQVAVADSFNQADLQAAFADGDTAFVLTPETGKSDDTIGDTRKILANYRAALEASPVRKVIGLSSMGAQYRTGNLEMSYLLEHAFNGLDAQTVFVRPAYYYSNWLHYLPPMKEQGILPTFYPADLKIPQNSPLDVAGFIAGLLVNPVDGASIYELVGPQWLSSQDVADAFASVLKRDVKAQVIPKEQWGHQLRQIGFTDDAVKNFIAMTETVVEGKAKPEGGANPLVQLETTLPRYLSEKNVA